MHVYETDLRGGLRRSATAQERTRALLEIFTPSELGGGTGKSDSTVRSWAKGRIRPQGAAWARLDVLRDGVRRLVDAGVSVERIHSWHLSEGEDASGEPQDPPLYLLVDDIDEYRAMVRSEALIEEFDLDNANVLQPTTPGRSQLEPASTEA